MKVMYIPMINMMKTGENINMLRQRSGISVRELQGILGFGTPQAIYKWQQGTALPSLDNLVILAAALGVTTDQILVTDFVQEVTAG